MTILRRRRRDDASGHFGGELGNRDNRPRAAQRRADAARARAVDILRDLVAVGEDGDRPDPEGDRGDAFPRIGENAGEARFGALRHSATLHPLPHGSDRAEPSDRVGASELVRVPPADMIGEDLDLATGRREGVREAGHQDFDPTEIRSETLGGNGDQCVLLSTRGGILLDGDA